MVGFMESEIRVQFLDEAVSICLRANAFWKDMNQPILPQVLINNRED